MKMTTLFFDGDYCGSCMKEALGYTMGVFCAAITTAFIVSVLLHQRKERKKQTTNINET